jgi:hypothetical protein
MPEATFAQNVPENKETNTTHFHQAATLSTLR